MIATAILLSAAAYLWAATRQVRGLVYLLKPGTMLLIIAMAVTGLKAAPSTYGWLILAGLLCSVAGDIFLMLPKDRFVAGLTSFLIAHLLYIAAFWQVAPPRPVAAEVITLALLAAVALPMYVRLARGIREKGKGRLLLPVALYISVISLMVWRAAGALGQPAGQLPPALPAAGALLFYLSDAALAWDRFVAPIPWRHLIVMGAYFAAQYCIALSVGS